MANRIRIQRVGFNWTTAFWAAGIAIVAPYVLRRIVPLFTTGNADDVSARDVTLAGKDSVRDVADDLGVGGVSGTVNRTIDRVTDHLTH